MEMNVPKKKSPVLRDLIFAFFFPTAVGKTLIFYFGVNYSNYPGRGYGTGLAISVAFTVFMVGRLLWKYRDLGEGS